MSIATSRHTKREIERIKKEKKCRRLSDRANKKFRRAMEKAAWRFWAELYNSFRVIDGRIRKLKVPAPAPIAHLYFDLKIDGKAIVRFHDEVPGTLHASTVDPDIPRKKHKKETKDKSNPVQGEAA